MAKSYPVGFRVMIPEPIEIKMISPTLKDRNNIDVLERYKGLFTYVIENDTFYYLSEGITNNHWKLFNKPQVIEVFDVFTDQTQAVVSGKAIQNYLLQNYYTKSEIDSLLEQIELPNYISNITQEDVDKLKSIKGDISEKVEFLQPNNIWFVNHPEGKSTQAFNLEGREIFGRKTTISETLTSYNWSKPLAGYVKIN